MKHTFLITIIILFSFLGCNPKKEYPYYEIIQENITESGSKIKYEAKAVLKPNQNLDKPQMEKLLKHIYDSVTTRTPARPNVVNIFLFTSKEHMESDMGQWVGRISKAKNDNTPNLQIQFLNSVNENPIIETSDSTQDGIALEQKQKIWEQLILAEDQAQELAEKKHPITLKDTGGKTAEEIDLLRERARRNMDLNREYEKKLNDKYRRDIIQKFEIDESTLEIIIQEGLDKNWPFPKKSRG